MRGQVVQTLSSRDDLSRRQPFGLVLARAATALLIIGLVLIDGWTPFQGITAPPVPRADHWLSTPEAPREALLVLPMSNAHALDWQRQAENLYFSTVHWRPLVNGTGSTTPDYYAQMAQVLDTYPSSAARAELRRLNVRLVLVRREQVSRTQEQQIRRACSVIFEDDEGLVCHTHL